jgi:hypothetical protein
VSILIAVNKLDGTEATIDGFDVFCKRVAIRDALFDKIT